MERSMPHIDLETSEVAHCEHAYFFIIFCFQLSRFLCKTLIPLSLDTAFASQIVHE